MLSYLAYELHLNLTTTGFLYLLAVVVLSTVSGLWEATVVSVLAVACLNYFFTPSGLHVLRLRPAEVGCPRGILSTALIVSRLSTRVKASQERNETPAPARETLRAQPAHSAPGPEADARSPRLYF